MGSSVRAASSGVTSARNTRFALKNARCTGCVQSIASYTILPFPHPIEQQGRAGSMFWRLRQDLARGLPGEHMTDERLPVAAFHDGAVAEDERQRPAELLEDRTREIEPASRRQDDFHPGRSRARQIGDVLLRKEAMTVEQGAVDIDGD